MKTSPSHHDPCWCQLDHRLELSVQRSSSTSPHRALASYRIPFLDFYWCSRNGVIGRLQSSSDTTVVHVTRGPSIASSSAKGTDRRANDAENVKPPNFLFTSLFSNFCFPKFNLPDRYNIKSHDWKHWTISNTGYATASASASGLCSTDLVGTHGIYLSRQFSPSIDVLGDCFGVCGAGQRRRNVGITP